VGQELQGLITMAVGATVTAGTMGDERRAAPLTASVLIGPATLIVSLGIFIPIAILFRYSLNQYTPGKLMVEALTADNYIKFVTDPYYRGVLFTTMRVSFITTVVCLILGFPLAYLLARTQSRFKNLLVMLVVLPMFVGNAVRAAGWMTLLGSKGMFNFTLMSVGIIDQPLNIMYTETAVVIGLIAVSLPLMVLTLQSVIEGIDRSIDEAALSLGAGPWATFRRVLWPLALPGIAAGTVLTFILTMNAYASPVLLGGPKFVMMAPLVYRQFELSNWPFGAAASFVLMTTTLALAVIANHMMQRRYHR
jgi:putative spermidine/putrescine transport system permease protein